MTIAEQVAAAVAGTDTIAESPVSAQSGESLKTKSDSGK